MPRKRKSKPPRRHKKRKGTRLWKSLKKGITDLINDHDSEVTAQRDFVVNYLGKALTPRKKKPAAKTRSRT